MLSKMHRVSLYIAIMWNKDYSGLKELYHSGWFEPDIDEEEQELEKEIEGELTKPPYWCEQIDGKVRIADFICDSLSRVSNGTFSAKPAKCSRRLEHDTTDDSCDGLAMHALQMEAIITPTPSEAFPCYACLRKVTCSPTFLNRYTDRNVPYCTQCLVKPRSMLLISERTLETDHGIPRKLQREQFRFHEFPLTVDIATNMPYTGFAHLDCRNGPVVAFRRPVKGTGPDHYYYYIGDAERIKRLAGAESGGLVSDDTRIKRVRKQPEVKEKIAALASALKAEGFKISRLSIGPINPAKRQKVVPALPPIPKPQSMPVPEPNSPLLPTSVPVPNLLALTQDSVPQQGWDDWRPPYL